MIPFSKSPSADPGPARSSCGSCRSVRALDRGPVSLGDADRRDRLRRGDEAAAHRRRRRRRRRGGVVLSARMTALAPAAGRSGSSAGTWSTCPGRRGNRSGREAHERAAASVGSALPSFTRTIWPATPAFVAGGPYRAHPAPKSPTPMTATWFWSPNVVCSPGHRNICIRGTPVPGVGSVGVEKFALFVSPTRPGPRSGRSRRRDPAAVVVRLEVPRRLVEAVAVEDVVERVAAVEQVRDNGVAVELRVLRQVGGEVEVEPRTAARAATEVLRLVVVLVEIGMVVVPAGDRELRPGDAVRVVPAERRSEPVGRVLHSSPESRRSGSRRQLEDAVARPVDHGVRRERHARRRDDRRAPDAEERAQVFERVVAHPIRRIQELARPGVHRRIPGRCAAEESSMVTCQARRSPLLVGCQPSRAGMAACEMPPLETSATPSSSSRIRRLTGSSSRDRRRRPQRRLRRRERLPGRSARRTAARMRRPRRRPGLVGRDVDGRVGIEDLEALELLVQIHVGNTAVGGSSRCSLARSATSALVTPRSAGCA